MKKILLVGFGVVTMVISSCSSPVENNGSLDVENSKTMKTARSSGWSSSIIGPGAGRTLDARFNGYGQATTTIFKVNGRGYWRNSDDGWVFYKETNNEQTLFSARWKNSGLKARKVVAYGGNLYTLTKTGYLYQTPISSIVAGNPSTTQVYGRASTIHDFSIDKQSGNIAVLMGSTTPGGDAQVYYKLDINAYSYIPMGRMFSSVDISAGKLVGVNRAGSVYIASLSPNPYWSYVSGFSRPSGGEVPVIAFRAREYIQGTLRGYSLYYVDRSGCLQVATSQYGSPVSGVSNVINGTCGIEDIELSAEHNYLMVVSSGNQMRRMTHSDIQI